MKVVWLYHIECNDQKICFSDQLFFIIVYITYLAVYFDIIILHH